MKTKKRRGFIWILVLVLMAAMGVALWRFWPQQPEEEPPISGQKIKEMPLLQQGDYPEAVTTFNGMNKSVATSGCGAVCVAMAASYLNQQPVSPQDLFQWACENNYYFGDGLGHEALTAMARNHNLDGEWIANDQLDRVKESLKAGYPVVAHMGPGVFTKGGHYILLRGVEEDGSVLVSDPQSPELSAQTHDLESIARELRRENCFMLITKPQGGSKV